MLPKPRVWVKRARCELSGSELWLDGFRYIGFRPTIVGVTAAGTRAVTAEQIEDYKVGLALTPLGKVMDFFSGGVMSRHAEGV